MAALTRLVRWDGTQIPFDPPKVADEEYYAFCVRFWRLYQACRQARLTVTVKSLDAYVWAVP